jgi:hypothetical protein
MNDLDPIGVPKIQKFKSKVKEQGGSDLNVPIHFKKLLMNRGALLWFETIWNYGVKAIDY